MRKRTSKPTPVAAVFIASALNPDVRDSLKILSAARKERDATDKPVFINAIVDAAIAKLAAMLKSGANVVFVPVPRESAGRTSFRITPTSHRLALKASENADVRLSDFVRTAISLYVRSHAREIYKEAKTASHRVRKSARR